MSSSTEAHKARVDELFQQVDEPFLRRWQDWQARVDFYVQLSTLQSFEKFKQWQSWSERAHYQRKLKTIELALLSLNELHEEKDKIAIDLVKSKVDILLMELEYTQLALGTKWQHLDPTPAKDLKFQLKEKKQRYQDKLEITPAINETNKPLLISFIKSEKSRFRFRKRIAVAKDIAAGVGTTSRFIRFLANMGHGFEILGSIFSAVPIISAITTAIPWVLTAVKSWLKNKSNTEKFISTALAALGIGIIISAGLATVATGGLIAGLITAGVVKNTVLPFIKIRNEINKIQTTLDELETKKNPNQLIQLEKSFIISALKEIYVRSPANKHEILQAINLVNEGGNINAIKANSYVKMAIENKPLEDFLTEKNMHAKSYLNEQLDELKKNESRMRMEVLNSLLAITGAILVCIPTPPTMILGASLLVVNSVVGITLRYNLIPRIIQFFSGKPAESMQREVKPVDESPSQTKPSIQHTYQLKPHESTTAVEVKLHNGNIAKVIAASQKTPPTLNIQEANTELPKEATVPQASLLNRQKEKPEIQKGEEKDYHHNPGHP